MKLPKTNSIFFLPHQSLFLIQESKKKTKKLTHTVKVMTKIAEDKSSLRNKIKHVKKAGGDFFICL